MLRLSVFFSFCFHLNSLWPLRLHCIVLAIRCSVHACASLQAAHKHTRPYSMHSHKFEANVHIARHQSKQITAIDTEFEVKNGHRYIPTFGVQRIHIAGYCRTPKNTLCTHLWAKEPRITWHDLSSRSEKINETHSHTHIHRPRLHVNVCGDCEPAGLWARSSKHKISIKMNRFTEEKQQNKTLKKEYRTQRQQQYRNERREWNERRKKKVVVGCCR